MKEDRCIYNGTNVLRDVYAKPGIYVINVFFFERQKMLRVERNLFPNQGTDLWSISTGFLGLVTVY